MYYSIYINLKKPELIYSGIRKISGYLGVEWRQEGVERGITMGHKETFESDRNNHYVDHDNGPIGVYMYQITSNYTL